MKSIDITAEQERLGDWSQVWGGGRVWPLDPRASEVNIGVIAHSLACHNRFGGHTRCGPYSVAQHSVYVARCAIERYGITFGLRGLLHDAHEAYIGDIIRPLKRSSVEIARVIDEASAAWDVAIGTALGVDLSPCPEIKDCDNAVLHAEKRDILDHSKHAWTKDGAPVPWEGKIEGWWEWTRARDEFMNMYTSLRRTK